MEDLHRTTRPGFREHGLRRTDIMPWGHSARGTEGLLITESSDWNRTLTRQHRVYWIWAQRIVLDSHAILLHPASGGQQPLVRVTGTLPSSDRLTNNNNGTSGYKCTLNSHGELQKETEIVGQEGTGLYNRHVVCKHPHVGQFHVAIGLTVKSYLLRITKVPSSVDIDQSPS